MAFNQLEHLVAVANCSVITLLVWTTSRKNIVMSQSLAVIPGSLISALGIRSPAYIHVIGIIAEFYISRLFQCCTEQAVLIETCQVANRRRFSHDLTVM